ncbi:hypothetical protein BKA69DRAFT_238612 [Paraphysoderma sedebokerense]|nr:hypothetical protein BKA69DRAFT_238612 [Paraphysoderma sedebokerense]
MLRDAYSRFVLLYVVCLVLISTVYGQQLPAAQRSWTLTPTTGAILDSVITDQAIYAIDSSYNLHVMSYNGDNRTIAAPTSTQLVNLFRSLPNNDWSFSRREATVAMAVGPNNQVYIAVCMPRMIIEKSKST